MLIIPSSIQVFDNNSAIGTNFWTFNQKSSTIIFFRKFSDSLTIKYKFLPLKSNFRNIDTTKIVPKLENKQHLSNSYELPLENNDLQTNGYFLRSIDVGNNQDAVLNSKMNLTIKGKLNNDMNIEAHAKDETMPIQPDGNTARIAELNDIYVRVYNRKQSIKAGDISAISDSELFLRYNKQLKGIEFEHSDSSKNFYSAGFGVAKGRYCRQIITPIEGIQGPYKLSGNDGEPYIVVLSATERVFIEGIELKRGENEDYVIDYNTAEITFTAKQIITKDTRIEVEFEYSERNYARFTFYSKNNLKVRNADFFVNFYSQKDAKNQTIDRELSNPMKLVLSQIGDSLQNAKILSFDTTAFASNLVLYKKIDTLINGKNISFFRYSTNPLGVHYTVNFSYVGYNKGSYKIADELTNGRIYKFIGERNGDYEPYLILVSPKSQQIINFGGKITVNKGLFSTDIAISHFDQNLFSNFNDNDNFGKAFKVDYLLYLKGSDSSKNRSFANFYFSNVGKRFSPVENIHNAEFYRYWNISEAQNTAEQLFGLNFSSVHKTDFLNFKLESLLYSRNFFGVKPQINGNQILGKFQINYIAALLFSNTSNNKTIFAQSKINLQKSFKKFYLGCIYEEETNIWKLKTADSILQNSFMFHSYNVFFQNSDTNLYNLNVSYSKRFDWNVYKNKFLLFTKSDNYNLQLNKKARYLNFELILKYRKLDFSHTTFIDTLHKINNFNAYANINGFFLNSALIINLIINYSTAMEPQMQFIYVETEPGKGQYTWIDYNNDGIKQIDEFEIAQFTDQATYIRIPLQSNDYTKVYSKHLSSNITFSPAKLFSENSKIYKLANKINNSLNAEISNKLPTFAAFDFSKTQAINYVLMLNNLTYFHLNSKIFINYNWLMNIAKQTLFIGIEKNEKNTHEISVNINFFKNSTFTNKTIFSNTISNADYTFTKNFSLREIGNKSSFKLILHNQEMEFWFNYKYVSNLQADENLHFSEVGTNLSTKTTENTDLNFNFTFVNNIFSGNENSSVAYSMLQGLKPGKNFLWNLQLNYQLSKIFKLTFNYSGRFSQNSKIIHTGNVSIVGIL